MGMNKADVPADCGEYIFKQRRTCWYFSKMEIEANSPSRKDDIDLKKESYLRNTYCSFIHDLGVKIGVPQVTIATAIMFCHRFYMRQSHKKNDCLTIAAICLFLASKAQDTPCNLDKIVVMSYELMYVKDPAYARRIYEKQYFEKQKSLMLMGERLLLSTICFDVNVEHPYGPLIRACAKFGNCRDGVVKAAWNLLNYWLRTTLCLQYKPHYIAAGSLFFAANRYGVKLPSASDYVWWHEFEVAPRQLREVIREMNELADWNKNLTSGDQYKLAQTCVPLQKDHAQREERTRSAEPQKLLQIRLPADEEDDSSSPESCILSMSGSSSSSLCCVSDLRKVPQDGISENPRSRPRPEKPDLKGETSHIGNDMNSRSNDNNGCPGQDVNRIWQLEEDALTTSIKKRIIRHSSSGSIRAAEQLSADSLTERAVDRSVTDLGLFAHKRRRVW